MSGTTGQREVPRFRFTEAQRFLLLAVLIGITTGLVIVCFHASLELLAWLVEDAAMTSPFLAVALPAAGAASAALFVRFVVPAAAGSGIVRTKAALYVSNGHIDLAAVPGKFVACTLSVGTGTPLGPEDPSLLMGAGIASWLGRLFELSRRSMRLVAPIGASAGIAAAFNTPITGVLFVMEEVVAAWDAAVLGSIVLASVSAVVVTRVFLGDAPLFSVPELDTSVTFEQAVAFAVLGVAAGMFAAAYVQSVAAIRHRITRHLRAVAVAPLAAGVLVGLAGLWVPEVLGPGYRAMNAALHNEYAWTAMAVLGVAKLIVAAVAFGAGVPGGLFAPTLFLGVMLGGTFGGVAPELVPALNAPMVTFVLAGISGVFAGVFRAPMTAVFMVFELSGSSAIIVPAMITATLGLLVARRLHHHSLLDLVAEEEGAALPSARQQREEEPLRVEQAMGRTRVMALDGGTSVADAVARAQERPADWVLVPHAGAWRGVSREVLAAPIASASMSATVAASTPAAERLDLHPGLVPLGVAHLDEPLDTALRHLAVQPVVPVVSRLDAAELLGAVSLADVHEAYGIHSPPPEGRTARS